MARGKGKRQTGWEEMEMGTQAFVRAGTPGTHHSAWYKVMPATIPLPLIPWFRNVYSSFKYLVACLKSLFLKEACLDPRGDRFATRLKLLLGCSMSSTIPAYFTQYIHAFIVFHPL